ncbi:MAG: RHS repeat-associated core domain-containing protein, partial [Planctomycetales bacterium]|nr:RHS repeat-associated core domain-containing protein [Planctomycetales bacterium]
TWSTVLSTEVYTSLYTTNRENYSTVSYDDLGRSYETKRYNGSNYLKTSSYYDRSGRQVASVSNGQAATEIAFDGAGRQYQTRVVGELEATKYSSGAFNYTAPEPEPSVSSMTSGNDVVYSLKHTEYDDASNAIASHAFEMTHNDSTLGINLSATTDYVRRSVYTWYDTASRVTHVGDYGSGDTAAGDGNWEYAAIPTRSSTAPSASSDTVLMTKYEYDADSGRLIKVTNWSDSTTTHVTRTWYDDLGRKSFVAENYSDFSPPTTNEGDGTDPSKDRVTAFEYNGLGKLTLLTAMAQNGTTDDQDTEYLFEDSVNASLVTNEIYPDSSDTTSSGTDQIKYTYNVDGSKATRTDQLGNVITYSYNDRRQPETESVTTLATGVDGNVRSIKRSYDSQARLEKVTSYASTGGTGTVRNEVQYEYNDLSQITKSYQSHSGAVNTGTSPSVSYSYDSTTSGTVYTRNHRLESVTHPSGRVTYYGYNTGTANSLHNRMGLIREIRETNSSGTQYAQYDYTGGGRLAIVDYQAPDIKLDYYQGSGTTYAGYDRFGRIKDQFWDGYGSTADVSRIKHGYDYAGNRLWREDVIAANNYQHHDELYTYDGLHRLVDFQRGDLNAGKTAVTSKDFAQDWTLDNLGNWDRFKQDDNGNGTWDLNQPRTHNNANELTTISADAGTNWADAVCDANGNMTTLPNPSSLTSGMTLTYDAWNRLVKVVDGTTLAECEYDGLNRRTIKTAGGTHYDYYFNNDWQILEVRKNNDVDPIVEFAWHPHYPDALAVRFYDADVNGSQVEDYYLWDTTFSVIAIASSSGSVQERYSYTSYGVQEVLEPTFSDDADGESDIWNFIAFTGGELDSETGLHHCRNRYHLASIGRFVSRDPILYMSGANLYTYVSGSPHNSTDPFGLIQWSEFSYSNIRNVFGDQLPDVPEKAPWWQPRVTIGGETYNSWREGMIKYKYIYRYSCDNFPEVEFMPVGVEFDHLGGGQEIGVSIGPLSVTYKQAFDHEIIDVSRTWDYTEVIQEAFDPNPDDLGDDFPEITKDYKCKTWTVRLTFGTALSAKFGGKIKPRIGKGDNFEGLWRETIPITTCCACDGSVIHMRDPAGIKVEYSSMNWYQELKKKNRQQQK